MTDPTQPRTWASTRSRSSAPRTERIASRAWNLWRSAHRNETYAAGDTFLAGYEAGCAAAVAPYVEALRRMTTAAAAERYDVWFNHHASPDLAWPDLFVAGYMEAARLLAAIPAVPEPPAAHVHVAEYPSSCEGCEYLAVELSRRLPPGLRSPEPPAAQTDAGLDADLLARAFVACEGRANDIRRAESQRIWGHPGAHIPDATFTWGDVAAEYARLASLRDSREVRHG